jgi:hypothetical protein
MRLFWVGFTVGRVFIFSKNPSIARDAPRSFVSPVVESTSSA